MFRDCVGNEWMKWELVVDYVFCLFLKVEGVCIWFEGSVFGGL